MKKIIRLTEDDLTRIVRRVINEKTDYASEEIPSDVCAELPNQKLESMEMELGKMLPGASVEGMSGDIVGGVINKLQATPEQKKTLRPQLDQFVESLKGLKLKDLMRKLSGLKQRLKGGSLTEQGIDPSAKGPAGAIMITALVAIIIAWIINEVKNAREYRKKRKKPGVKRNAQCLNRKF